MCHTNPQGAACRSSKHRLPLSGSTLYHPADILARLSKWLIESGIVHAIDASEGQLPPSPEIELAASASGAI